ncbi:thiamine pyrophosphate-binding protein [Micromonospora echinospora]|uniref:thiamine pyrophosphate-binding protein n=1 Tax=Micromonospora echinospora TaxID=1877 RepID=UPI0033DC688D
MNPTSQPRGPALADTLADAIRHALTGPFYCTPDGLQRPLLDSLGDRVTLHNVVREDIAVGLAAGASLAGRTPVVLMQNSGLGQSVNALASLVLPYGLPMLLVVGMRGIDLDDTKENLVMGRITERLLEMMEISARFVAADDPARDVAAAAREVHAGRTSALLIRPGLFAWRPDA